VSPRFWTPERLGRARKLRADGLAYAVIGFRLGASEQGVRDALRRKLSPYTTAAESKRARLDRVAAEMRERNAWIIARRNPKTTEAARAARAANRLPKADAQ
jgi:hypothetical protein